MPEREQRQQLVPVPAPALELELELELAPEPEPELAELEHELEQPVLETELAWPARLGLGLELATVVWATYERSQELSDSPCVAAEKSRPEHGSEGQLVQLGQYHRACVAHRSEVELAAAEAEIVAKKTLHHKHTAEKHDIPYSMHLLPLLLSVLARESGTAADSAAHGSFVFAEPPPFPSQMSHI